jgi:D-alanyl-D-alanine carboxypeptidase
MKKKLILIGAAVLVLAAGYFGYRRLTANTQTPAREQAQDNRSAEQSPQQAGFDKSRYSIDEPGSLWWIVNKQRPLEGDYKPAEMTAPNVKLRWARDAETMQVSTEIAEPLESMDKAMRQAGLNVELISGYRSAAFQKELYDDHVRQYGQAEADRQSARPGTSEHQTGLVVDLGRPDKKCDLLECFGDTPEGKWLAAHAHEYGFIIRYLKDKEQHTGYMYEPWHLRYVGKELAAELHAKKQTMEEFFGL